LLAGTLGAAFLGIGQVFLELARFSRVDSFFAFLLALSAILAHEAERPRGLGRSLGLSALSGVALAGAMLTKSPLLAIVLHVASIGGYYIVDLVKERPWERLREPAPLTILRRFVAPPASVPPILACALFACWLVPFKASLTPAEWDAVWNQFCFENTERAVTGSDKPHPFWFYVPQLLLRAAPGSLFAFILVRHEDPEVRSTHRFAQCWWVFPFIVLSIATGKNARYLLPCLPGIAVAAALNWCALTASSERVAVLIDRGVAWIALVFAVIGAATAPVAVALLAPEVLGDTCCLAILGAGTAAFSWRATRGRGGVWPLLLAFFTIEAMWNVVLLPSPPFEKPRTLVKHLAKALPDDVKLNELVYYVPPTQIAKGESRQRRTRTLLSIYRDEPDLPLLALSQEELFRELSVSERRRGLLDGPAWDSLAPVASSLVVDRVLSVPLSRGEERYRLVRRAR
ncbi:MAG: phospholipid carrier-dependent glycosyltransferase, partial [Planctomycetota bacterium]